MIGTTKALSKSHNALRLSSLSSLVLLYSHSKLMHGLTLSLREGVLLYVLRREEREVQARAIHILRYTIRKEFKDIRNNSDVGRALWKHVNELRASPDTWPIPGQPKNAAKKRKRASGRNDDDDDDGEFRPQPVRSMGKPVKTRKRTG